jgi:hypothetical protein
MLFHRCSPPHTSSDRPPSKILVFRFRSIEEYTNRGMGRIQTWVSVLRGLFGHLSSLSTPHVLTWPCLRVRSRICKPQSPCQPEGELSVLGFPGLSSTTLACVICLYRPWNWEQCIRRMLRSPAIYCVIRNDRCGIHVGAGLEITSAYALAGTPLPSTYRAVWIVQTPKPCHSLA